MLVTFLLCRRVGAYYSSRTFERCNLRPPQLCQTEEDSCNGSAGETIERAVEWYPSGEVLCMGRRIRRKSDWHPGQRVTIPEVLGVHIRIRFHSSPHGSANLLASAYFLYVRATGQRADCRKSFHCDRSLQHDAVAVRLLASR